MSLLEEARAVRERIAARLRELEPLVKEYNELRQAAAEMGIEAGEASVIAAPRPALADADPRPRPVREEQWTGATATETAAAPPANSREPGGEIGARVLDAVRAEPGMTVSEYARRLNLPPASMYRPVRELANRGAIVKRARQLFPG